jgi:hypothetical protein
MKSFFCSAVTRTRISSSLRSFLGFRWLAGMPTMYRQSWKEGNTSQKFGLLTQIVNVATL